MTTLRLFHAADPFNPIDARACIDGEWVLGRDPAADWAIDDSTCELSRRHCVIIANQDGHITVRDVSANGVFRGPERRRLEKDNAVAIEPGETLHLGPYMIVVDGETQPPVASNDPSPFHAPLLATPQLDAHSFAVRDDWPDAPVRADAPLTEATLLDAFCAGARLDASNFAGDDPTETLRRVGAIYQLVVLGLGELMNERTSLKAEYRMDRTTVAAAGNNPLKWAPTQRLAIDLLRDRNDAFLSGPAALKASFEDLRKHILCVMAGSRAAVAAAFDALNPDDVEENVKNQSLLFMSKSEACWREVQRRHASLVSDARDNPDSEINRAFKAGYEQQLRALDEMGTLS